jgi:predicted nucleic acid-binding protein
VKTCLIDTGPLVAYLDRRDQSHQLVTQSLSRFKGRLATTGAVVSEVMYFVSEFPNGPAAFAQFLTSSETHVADMCQPSHVLASATLMSRYSDTPMDFADATLVLLADHIGAAEIFTLDRRGFSTYRTGSGKRFHLL